MLYERERESIEGTRTNEFRIDEYQNNLEEDWDAEDHEMRIKAHEHKIQENE